jgi:hypothetical protein
MIEKIRKHKWKIHWCAFSTLILLFVFTALLFENKTWLPNVLQTIGTIVGIYLTIIIFLQSKEESDKQFREQLEHLQNLNAKQIEVLQENTEKQLTALQTETEKQIDAIQKATEKQIEASQQSVQEQIKSVQELTERQIETVMNSTEKQIGISQELNANHIDALFKATEKQVDALQRTTFEQISSFEKETRIVTDKLTDNSILLAEILGRELEKSMDAFGSAIKREEARYDDLSGWKFLRTPAEREQQLNNQWNRIQSLKKWYEYIVNKYKQVKNFIGNDQRRLNE